MAEDAEDAEECIISLRVLRGSGKKIENRLRVVRA
jgi:hypothetical protein